MSMLAALLLAVVLPAGLAESFVSVDAAQGQLPKTVVPLLYRIDLIPSPTSDAVLGHELITVIVRESVRTIVINALQLTFERVALDGITAKVRVDNKHQLAAFTFSHALIPGQHNLSISYVARMQHSGQGLFRQPYDDGKGAATFLYASQLEPTDARRLFPSFDEPAFKARFRLSITIPTSWVAISNEPVSQIFPAAHGIKRVAFATTPPMSTYLLAVVAGDLESLHAISDGIPVGVYVTRGKLADAVYALSVMKELTPYYDQFYGVKFPLPKLDMIALPGGITGAMENWGAITYIETALLFNASLQPESQKRDIFEIIAHEESHQWNGDLTTMPWWDELWLNEGFATWIMVKASDHFHPEWRRWLNADEAVDDALASDALSTTHAIYSPVANVTEAAAAFDDISYVKAGAVLRMLEGYIGAARFQKGLAYYFETHQYTSARATAIATPWIYQRGFPVVTASSSPCDHGERMVTVTQQRYVEDSNDTEATLWPIPLNVERDARSGTFTPVLLRTKSQRFYGGACDAPLMIKGDDIGFYRVAYDSQLQTLQRRYFTELSSADRLGILNDSWAFARSGRSNIRDYLRIIDADAGDSDPMIVLLVLQRFEEMLKYERGKPGEIAFKQYVAGHMRPLLAQLGGWDISAVSDEQVRARNRALYILAKCDDQTTVAEAKRRFTQLLASPESFSPLTRQLVVYLAGYAADSTIYSRLKAMLAISTNAYDRELIFSAMAAAKNPELARLTLESALHLPPELAEYAPFMVETVAGEHPVQAWQFLTVNAEAIFGATSMFDRMSAMFHLAVTFSDSVPAEKIRAFLTAHLPLESAKEIDKAMSGIRANQVLQQRLVPEIDSYVRVQHITAVNH